MTAFGPHTRTGSTGRQGGARLLQLGRGGQPGSISGNRGARNSPRESSGGYPDGRDRLPGHGAAFGAVSVSSRPARTGARLPSPTQRTQSPPSSSLLTSPPQSMNAANEEGQAYSSLPSPISPSHKLGASDGDHNTRSQLLSHLGASAGTNAYTPTLSETNVTAQRPRVQNAQRVEQQSSEQWLWEQQTPSRSTSPLAADSMVLDCAVSTPPLGVQDRELGMRLIARQHRWGSLESAWLVKNAFAAWRTLLRCRPTFVKFYPPGIHDDKSNSRTLPSPAERTMYSDLNSLAELQELQDSVAELQKAMAVKDLLITELEQRLTDIVQGEPKLRRNAACLSVERATDLCRSDVPLMQWCFAKFQHAAAETQLQRQVLSLEKQVRFAEHRCSETDKLLDQVRKESDKMLDQVRRDFKQADLQHRASKRKSVRTAFSMAARARVRGARALFFRAWATLAHCLPARRRGFLRSMKHIVDASGLQVAAEVLHVWHLHISCSRRCLNNATHATWSIFKRRTRVLMAAAFVSWTESILATRWQSACTDVERQCRSLAQTKLCVKAWQIGVQQQRRMIAVEKILDVRLSMDLQTFAPAAFCAWQTLLQRKLALNATAAALCRKRAELLVTTILALWSQLRRDQLWSSAATAQLDAQSARLHSRSSRITKCLGRRWHRKHKLAQVFREWAATSKHERYISSIGLVLTRGNARLWLNIVLTEWWQLHTIAKSGFAMEVASRNLATKLHMWGTEVAEQLTYKMHTRAIQLHTFSVWLRETEDGRITDKVAWVVRWGHTRLWVAALLGEWQRAHAATKWNQATEYAFHDLAAKLHIRGINISDRLAHVSHHRVILLLTLSSWSQFCAQSRVMQRAGPLLCWGHTHLWLAAILAEWQRVHSFAAWGQYTRSTLQNVSQDVSAKMQKCMLTAEKVAWAHHVDCMLAEVFNIWERNLKNEKLRVTRDLVAAAHWRGIMIAEMLTDLGQLRLSESEVFSAWLRASEDARVRRLHVAIADTHLLIEILAEWRIWAKQVCWGREQHSFMATLSQANAQIQEARIADARKSLVATGRVQTIHRASGRIVSLHLELALARAFAGWSRSIALAHHRHDEKELAEQKQKLTVSMTDLSAKRVRELELRHMLSTLQFDVRAAWLLRAVLPSWQRVAARLHSEYKFDLIWQERLTLDYRVRAAALHGVLVGLCHEKRMLQSVALLGWRQCCRIMVSRSTDVATVFEIGQRSALTAEQELRMVFHSWLDLRRPAAAEHSRQLAFAFMKGVIEAQDQNLTLMAMRLWGQIANQQLELARAQEFAHGGLIDQHEQIMMHGLQQEVTLDEAITSPRSARLRADGPMGIARDQGLPFDRRRSSNLIPKLELGSLHMQTGAGHSAEQVHNPATAFSNSMLIGENRPFHLNGA